MYIWKTASLATDIKNDKVETGEWKKYYLATSIFMTLALYLSALTPREAMLSMLVEVILMLGILIFAIQATYQSNLGDNGVNYIARMTALSFPLIIKFFLISLLFGGVIGALSEVALFSESVMEWVMVGFVTLVQAAFFWRLNCHIKSINA